MDLSIIIPCYNEIENVQKLRDEFFPVASRLAETRTVEVIFVDDGSTDGTLETLQGTFKPEDYPEIQLRFEKHDHNRGLGAAVRTGFRASRGEIVLTTDSDGTYRFQEIIPLLECLAPGIDLVTASPYHPKGGVENVPGFRLLFSKSSSLLYRLLVNWRIHTYTALFRAYRREVIENVPFSSDGFLAGTEILVNSMLTGYRVAEYPSVLHSRAAGVSKAKIARTIRAHLGFQWRIFLYRLSLAPLPGRVATKRVRARETEV